MIQFPDSVEGSYERDFSSDEYRATSRRRLQQALLGRRGELVPEINEFIPGRLRLYRALVPPKVRTRWKVARRECLS